MNFDDYQLKTDGHACLVSLVCESFEGHTTEVESKESLRELRELLRTLDISRGSEFIQNRKQLDAGTLLGKGFLEEIAEKARKEEADILVFDFELSASQLRNIKEITKLEVVDRNTVILEIFARHAQTREAKIQIEISRLQYILPRLTSLWTHLSRQGGGLGVRGGEGEQQIELDRRMIRKRIEFFKVELEEIATSRQEQRKKRQHKAVTAALVGYTNAGKSTLMNKLCKVNVLAEDKLFATLDSTFRALNPDTKPPMILIDTVGFISNLPTSLVTGFKTTLESAVEADLLVVVVDVSDASWRKHLSVTEKVLGELGLSEKERIVVFNKKDKITGPFDGRFALRAVRDSFLISASDDEDIKKLRSYIINYFLDKQTHYDLFIPYEDAKFHSVVRGQTNVVKEKSHEAGMFYRIRIPEFLFQSLHLLPFLMAPELPRPW